MPLNGALPGKGLGPENWLCTSASSTELRKHDSANASSCKQPEVTPHHRQQKAGDCPYREMIKGHVHLSQEVVSCLLRREQRVNVPIDFTVRWHSSKRFFANRDKGPGPDTGEPWGQAKADGPDEAHTAAALGTGEPQASHTGPSAGPREW